MTELRSTYMIQVKESESQSTFSSDNPVLDPSNDMLGYAPFSKLLAQSISRMCPKEGIVVAINGPWGSGKSTILNFVLYYLEHEFADQPVIPIHFNPWWFSGRENLTRLLIGQIRAQLGDKDYGELKGKLANYTELVTSIPGVPVKDTGGIIAKILRREPDLVSLKNRIDELLHSSDNRILVIIDDIDRLAPDEIRDLFRTIKATGNFPNVIYLLAFDISVVVESLEQTFIPDANSYLEKIVQVPFSLPLPDKAALRKLLFARLGEITAGTDEANFDAVYWANAYYSGIDHFIVTPRDVVRLINVLRATYPSVKDEVNPVDFISIEAIRVFMPKLYDEIRSNQDLLAGASSESGQERTTEQRKTVFETWLKILPEGDRDSAKNLLSLFFPRFSSAFGGARYGYEWLSSWRRQLRACSPDKFPIFFRFALGSDSISKAEINALLDVAGDSKTFGELLLKYAGQIRSDGSSRVRAMLEYLQDYTMKDIPVEDIPAIINTFFEIGDSLLLKCDGRGGLFDIGNEIRIMWLIDQLLHRVDEMTRFEIISSAIESGSSIAIITHEVVVWGQEHGKFGVGEPRPVEDRTFTAEHLNILEDMAVVKITEAAEDGSLLSSPNLVGTLYPWRIWTGSDDPVRDWANNIIAMDDDLILFVEQFGSVRKSQGLSDHAAREKYRLDPKWLEPYIDPNKIVNRLERIRDTSQLDAEKMKAVSQFLHEHDLRVSGKDPEREVWK
jgi:predicted KAP-like P-loop ATPase